MLIEGEYYYHEHLGGIYGRNETKMWTIITISMIKLSAEKNKNLAIDIMCQGDNQVVIRYKPSLVPTPSLWYGDVN